MKLLLTTQVFENYAWREDGSIGTGADAYWKAKGGSEYVVKNFKDTARLTEAVMALRPQVETDSDYFREHLIDWQVVPDDYLTEFELNQLAFEGKITFPATELKDAWL
jgi:hypothetical protein